MFFLKRVKVRSFEMGLHFRDGEFRGLLGTGRHGFFDPFGRDQVEVVSQRAPFLVHEKLDLIVKSSELKGNAQVLDLEDGQYALVWIDRRFARLLPPGQYVYWTNHRDVRVEIVEASARRARFEHEELKVIVRNPSALASLEVGAVGRGCVGVLFLDGHFAGTLDPGPQGYRTIDAGIPCMTCSK
jgi:hypothetical protein